MTHSKNDKESHPFFKPNQGNKGKNQQHRYMNDVENHRDIKQNSIQNEKIHSSQWTYLECLLEPNLLVFKLCLSLCPKYPIGLRSPNSVPFSRKTIGFVSQEIPAHPLTTLFSPMSAFLLFPKPHLLKTLSHISLPSIFQTPSLHPTCSVFLSFFYPSLSFPYKLLPNPLLLVQRRHHPQSPPWQNGDVCHTSMQLAPFGNRLLPLQKIKIKT